VNRNEPLNSLIVENELRNAFIRLNNKTGLKRSKRIKKMNMKNKALVFALIAVFAISSLGLSAGFADAKPSTMNANSNNNSNQLLQRSYIRLNGQITAWGTADAHGQLQTQARVGTHAITTNLLASATAIWTTNTSRPISAVRTKENFTYTFYEARLANASVSSLSANATSPRSYFLNGTWNLYTSVSTVTIITNVNGSITNIHRDIQTSIQKLYGELNVTDNWSKFTLSINGIDPLTGSVHGWVQRQMQFNPFKITSDSTTDSVTKADFGAIMRNYRAMPGWGNYNVNMDFNNNYQVDLADLSTVACNM
jgi:hypothetical protein